jgi:hypothetical protein
VGIKVLKWLGPRIAVAHYPSLGVPILVPDTNPTPQLTVVWDKRFAMYSYLAKTPFHFGDNLICIAGRDSYADPVYDART